jgi:hypothetical protein
MDSQERRYLIPNIEPVTIEDDNPEYSIIKTTLEGKEGFYGAHGAGIITGAYFTVELAEQALLKELQKRITKESVRATQRAADLAHLAFCLSANGFKGFKG